MSKPRTLFRLFLLALALASCGDGPKGDDTAFDDRQPGEDTTVTVFDGDFVWFGDENRRQVDVEVAFPDDATTYGQLPGRFALRCPDGCCDWWDRYGTFGLVLDPGTDAERTVELDRFITAYLITGHGWNNSQNCAEFCAKEHFYTGGGAEFGTEVWREDCADTVTDGTQQGTWTDSRAGWCPGAQVFPWDSDVTARVEPGATTDVSYRLEYFVLWGDGDQPYCYMSGMFIGYR